jgi:hypothetical protein
MPVPVLGLLLAPPVAPPPPFRTPREPAPPTLDAPGLVLAKL